MNRVAFVIDGFNLYHSARQAEADLGGASTKWLDVRALCEGYLYLFGRDATLASIHYFSALARHLEATNPDVTNRHAAFVDALRSTGVATEMSRFKRKTIPCPHCGQRFARYEEKETDVALAIAMIELLATDACDTVVLVTGDTDLAPAIRAAQRLYPEKHVTFAFPYRRKNNELAKLAPSAFEIGRAQYARHQLPDPVRLRSGRLVAKPATW